MNDVLDSLNTRFPIHSMEDICFERLGSLLVQIYSFVFGRFMTGIYDIISSDARRYVCHSI